MVRNDRSSLTTRTVKSRSASTSVPELPVLRCLSSCLDISFVFLFVKRSFHLCKPCHPTSIIPQPWTAPRRHPPPPHPHLFKSFFPIEYLVPRPPPRAAAIATQYFASIDASKGVMIGIESVHLSTRYTFAHRPIKSKQRLRHQGTEGTSGQCRSVTFSKRILLSMRHCPPSFLPANRRNERDQS